MLPVLETRRNDSRLASWLGRVGQGEALVTALEAVPGAAFVVDEHREILYWSSGAERLLGFTAAEVVGEHCLKSNRCNRCLEGCGVAEHGAIEGAPLTLFDRHGQRVSVRKYARAFERDGAFAGAVELLLPAPAATAADAVLAEVSGTSPRDGAIRGLPPVGVSTMFHGIVTADFEMQELLKTLRDVARADVSVLIRGESGTGKELFAHALHAESDRSEGPFVAVNCAALSPQLLESELFGHERGAFTGAVRRHEGVFEQADGGTLFLDEVGELPAELQAKLLRVLQDQKFTRVGGTRALHVDARVVSATNKSLRAAAAAGTFREDLLYRLRVVPLYIPALRERRADIPLLVDHFLAQLRRQRGTRAARLSDAALRVLLEHDWPGNVRELFNVLQYASVVASTAMVEPRDLPPELRPSRNAEAARDVGPGRYRAPSNEDEERQAIERALEEAGGHIGRAAAALGMSRPTLWRRRKRFGI